MHNTKDHPLISIIMPCYNCSSTLKEAFDSIYRQNFKYPFEVILVDDGSTDTTVELIQSLIAGRKECTFIQHTHNKGGGAARNTAIKASKGKLIFCLDSDDILADASLPLMIEYLEKEGLDGTIFQYRRFFSNNPKKHREESNPAVVREIELGDLFETSDKRILFNNFVYTRKAYDIVGGYPEDHGFDTPEFEFGFLGRGLRSKICPGSTYYHRQGSGKKSYFDREYEKGLFSLYVYLALEPVLSSLTDSVIDLCVTFDVATKNELRNENNLLSAIRQQYAKDGNLIFLKEKNKRSLRTQTFLDAVSFIRQEDYHKAIAKLELCVKEYQGISPVLLFSIARSLYGSSGTEHAKVISATLQWLGEYGILKKRTMRRLPPVVSKLYLTCKRLFSTQ